MIVGGYTLDLYCDNYKVEVGKVSDGVHGHRDFPHTYFGDSSAYCRRCAREDGRLFKKNGKVLCPMLRKV